MSVMDGGAPPSINVPGQKPLSGPPKGDHSDSLREAIELIRTYLEGEQDDEDIAEGMDILARAQKLLAKQQKLTDSAMGIGPGEKVMRKQGGASRY